MNESILYNICMLVSTMVEVYLVFDFYKAFHAKTEISEAAFGNSGWQELSLYSIQLQICKTTVN